MLIILSSAKLLNITTQSLIADYTLPDFLYKSQELINCIRQLDLSDIAHLTASSIAIAKTNYERFYNWHLPFTPDNAKQAVLVFNGEVFNGLQARSFNYDDFVYVQDHLRILSGLYGVLRPLDLIQPYRLEIGSKLDVGTYDNLYDFWADDITPKLIDDIKYSGKPKVLVNLASNEYFKSINRNILKARVLHIEFYEIKADKLKTIVVYTKKARGMMARYIIKNRIEDPELIKGFDEDNYFFNSELSNYNTFVFVRKRIN
jgi:cytoplasmic iron level regulating protein YaaA (DUF328/UPF0246 family)